MRSHPPATWRPVTRRTLRAPTLAGIAVVLISAVVMATIALIDTASSANHTADPTPAPTTQGQDPELVILAMTSNMYAQPSRTADIVAIIPVDRSARITGQTEGGEWLRVQYPVSSSLEGWIAATNVITDSLPDLAAVESFPLDGAVPGSEGQGPLLDEAPLPDLTISSAEVGADGMLEVRVTNVGRATFADQVDVRVTTAEGALLGMLDIDLTDQPLTPGRSASVSTGVRIIRTGLYVIEVDSLNRVEEAGEFNNTRRVLLVGTGE